MKTRFFALAALALSLAACTQDEAGFLQEGAEGTPIVFTATGLNPAATAIAGTRAPADGNWTGVQSVAVLMDGMVKTYDVTPSTADPTSATLTSTDPYYWTNHKDITVTAWWPYTEGETTPPAVKVKANQSAQKDFEGSDLIVANGQTVTYGKPHAPLHPPHGAGDHRSDGLHRGAGIRAADGPLHRRRQPGYNRPV